MNDSDLFSIKKKLDGLSIHVIPYCHADYAWTHPRSWHVSRYKQVIDEVLDIMNQNPSYKWMVDNILHILTPYYDTVCNRNAEMTDRINEGRIEVTNGVMSLLRPTTAGGETFMRNIIYGRRWMKTRGIESCPEVFHNVDVSIGHSQLPQLLKLSGFLYYRGWRPQGALDSVEVPRDFIWKGADGSEIFCSRGTYAGIWKADYLNKPSFADNDESLIKFYKNELDDISSRNTTGVVWLPFGMDDTRPLQDFHDTPVNLDNFMDYLRMSSGTRIHYSTAIEYFKEMSGKPLPIFKGVLDHCDVGYNVPTKGDKGLWYFRDVLDAMIIKTETIWVMASAENIPYPYEEIDSAWKNLLYISGHAMEFTFSNDYESLYHLALNTIETLNQLIQKAAIKIVSLHNAGSDSHIFINTLENERRGIYSMTMDKAFSQENICVVDENYKQVECQVVCDSNLLVDLSIPGFGTKTLTIETSGNITNYINSIEEANGIIPIDTGSIRILFKKGFINQIDGLNFDSSSPFGRIGFTEIEPSPKDAWLHNYNHGRFHEMFPTEWSLIEKGPLRWKYMVSGYAGPATVKIEITLTRNSSAVGYDITLDCTDKSNGFFTISFPAGTEPDITAGIPFGFESRPISSESYGKQTDIEIDNLERLWPGLFYANGWINYTFKDINFTVLREKLPSYFWFDKSNKRISAILTRTFNLAKCSDWMKDTHHYHECIGKTNFRFSVKVGGNSEKPSIIKSYRELRHSPIQVKFPAGEVNKTIYHPPIEIKSDFCVLSALYKDKGTTIVRIFNTTDNNDNLEIISKRIIKSCRPVDIMHRNITRNTRITYDDYSICTILGKYEILTLSINF